MKKTLGIPVEKLHSTIHEELGKHKDKKPTTEWVKQSVSYIQPKNKVRDDNSISTD